MCLSPESEFLRPSLHARENLSHHYSNILLKYADNRPLADYEQEYLRNATEMLDEFASVLGDDAMHPTARGTLVTRACDSERLEIVVTVGARQVLGSQNRQEKLAKYRQTVNAVLERTATPAEAKELGTVFRQYADFLSVL